MRSSIRNRAKFIGLVCAGLFFCCRAIAGHDTKIYSDQDVTGGVVVEISRGGINIREKGSGEVRGFRVYDGGGGPEIEVTLDGQPAAYGQIKIGMHARISFFRKADKKKIEGHPPMISVDAISNIHRK